jgi:pSer/pThr/pTyr-binding forkhead associated (FHA) protein
VSAKVILQVISGPIRGEVFKFENHDTFIFGRGEECHAKLPEDRYVSRHHFLLEVNPPTASIRDLGSLNGTHVNGVRYGGRKARPASADDTPNPGPETDLRDGDAIIVGKTKIRVRIKLPQAEAGRAASPPSPAGQKKPSAGKRLYVPTQTESFPGASRAVPSREQRPSPLAANHPQSTPDSADSAAGRSAADKPDEVGGVRALIRQAAKDFQSRQKIEVDGYELGEIVGQGGAGVVYKAVRKLDRFPVAVKVMLAKVAVRDKARQRFLREVDAIRELSHANVVSLIASGAVENAFYFVSEYCNGGSLSELTCRQGGRVPLPVLAPIILQSLEGLAHAHQHGFVHRDIKPANILLHQQQRGWAAKLSDFGLAKQFEQAGFSGMTLTGAVGGTYDYMPREQLTDFKNTQPVSDVWSLGATFYLVLTGACPRPRSEGRDPMEVVLRDEHVPVRQRDPGLPPALARVIDKSLAIETADRYQDAGEMYRALNEVLSR